MRRSPVPGGRGILLSLLLVASAPGGDLAAPDAPADPSAPTTGLPVGSWQGEDPSGSYEFRVESDGRARFTFLVAGGSIPSEAEGSVSVSGAELRFRVPGRRDTRYRMERAIDRLTLRDGDLLDTVLELRRVPGPASGTPPPGVDPGGTDPLPPPPLGTFPGDR